MSTLKIGVYGAGAIGGFLGLHAAAVGARVTLVGRPALVALRGELRARRLGGRELRAAPSLAISDDPAALADASVVLVTVKSRDTVAAGERLAALLSPSALVVSFQNGLGNLPRLGRALGPRVVAGMVSFNVIREEGGALLRQATDGPLCAGPGEGAAAATMRELAEIFAAAGLPLELRQDIDAIAAGKLLLNLNNGIGAATGLPIAATLRSRDARWCFARCIVEGLAALRHAGYKPANVIGLPPAIIARALPLPDAIVLRIARRLIAVDPDARSSTLQDLLAGKPTEISELNGAIASLADAHGLAAPANRTIAAIVRALEGQGPALPFVPPSELRRRIAEAAAAT